MKTIQNEKDLLDFLSAESKEQAKRHVYKYTDCGAWIEFKPDGIRIGSIVEGCDFGTAIYPLSYPFSCEDYAERMKAIEKEASALWDWANVARDKNGRRHMWGTTDAQRGLDTPDIDFEYQHLNPDGRSS